MPNTITVVKMEREMITADIGRNLKWEVNGPNGELQRFHTKEDAKLYKRIRGKCETSNEAHTLYCRC